MYLETHILYPLPLPLIPNLFYVGMVSLVRFVGRQTTFEKPAPQEKHATRESVTLSPEYTRNKEAPSPLFF